MARVRADADRAGVLHAIAGGVVDEFGAALARIWLFDPSDDALHLSAGAGVEGDALGVLGKVPVQDSRTIVARAFTSRQMVAVDDLSEETWPRHFAWAREQGLHGYAGFPLLVGERAIGAMGVGLCSPWPSGMLDALGVLAQQAALALDHARLLEETHTLQGIAAELASERDVRVLLERLVERTAAVLKADGCAVWLLDEKLRRILPGAHTGLSAGFVAAVVGLARQPSPSSAGTWWEHVRRTGTPLVTRDEQTRAREAGDPLLGAMIAEGVVSACRLPLFEPGGRVIGGLAIYHRRERFYSDDEVRLAQAFTDQIAVALYNARLAEREREARNAVNRQVERLTALVQITKQLLAASELETVLRVVVESAGRLCGTGGAMIGLIDPDGARMHNIAAHGFVEQALQTIQYTELTRDYLHGTPTGLAISRGEVVCVEDVERWPTAAQGPLQRTLAAGIRAFISAPLRAGGRVIGVLRVVDSTARTFSVEDRVIAEALADQAALAIEHTRLLLRGQDAAALEERARLARDLHDSVTQTVFSVGLLARAAQTQQTRGSSNLAGTLDRVTTLADEALQEMRALVTQLRPVVLAEEGLGAALEKLAESFRVRSGLPVTCRVEADVRLCEEMETAIFRIVQEALANAAKHARASAVAITLRSNGGRLIVTVEDDGQGFDLAAPVEVSADGRRGGMGLRSMRERAAAAGLSVRLTSSPGAGSRVTVEAPLSEQAAAGASA